MIISPAYAKRLIRQGKASKGAIVEDNGTLYQSIDRHDLQRVDHYCIGDAP